MACQVHQQWYVRLSEHIHNTVWLRSVSSNEKSTPEAFVPEMRLEPAGAKSSVIPIAQNTASICKPNNKFQSDTSCWRGKFLIRKIFQLSSFV
jgi:hypothetical protein